MPDPDIKWLLAEYNPAPFYCGWWLYERDRNDGTENDDPRDRWGWLRDNDRPQPVYRLLAAMGRADAPVVPDYPPPGGGQPFAAWFAENYPLGLRVRKAGGEYELLKAPGDACPKGET